MVKIGQNKALWYARKSIAQTVTDVVNLEDINYTVPEVQTLLDGITVGGHTIQDELITLNQINAWNFLFESIEKGTFEVTKSFVLKLHAIVANQEALTWGEFRTQMVSIAGTSYMPPKPGELDASWNKLVGEVDNILTSISNIKPDKLNTYTEIKIYNAAMRLFAEMARIQFFFDGNKRTGRMMMSGLLLSHGYPMINVSAKRKLEFNQVMIDYYNTEQWTPIRSFLLSCLEDWILTEFNLELS